MTRRTVLPTIALALTCTGCSGSSDRPAGPSAPAGASASVAPSAPAAGRVVVQVGRAAPVTAEVADDAQERAVGLMGRTSVPRGTGMVFRYDRPSTGRYYMFRVPVPLTAVFARGGRVVGVVDMPPCREATAAACPTYGPDEPFDTVLETAPETLVGLVEVGDALRVRGG